jgi:hypothetical protein
MSDWLEHLDREGYALLPRVFAPEAASRAGCAAAFAHDRGSPFPEFSVRVRTG